MSTELFNVADIFGENVFNDTVMQERLPKKVYKNLRKTIEEGKDLDLETADDGHAINFAGAWNRADAEES